MFKDQPAGGSYRSYRLFRVVFVGLTLLTTIVLASVVPEMAAIDVRKKLNNAVQLEHDLGELLVTLLNAETGQRGFLLTNDREYLGPYLKAQENVDKVLDRIEDEIRQDTTQIGRLARLRRTVDHKFADLATTIQMKARGDTAALSAMLATYRGMIEMDAVREDVELLRLTELHDIRIRQTQLSNLSTVTTVLRFLGVLGLGFVFYYIYSQLRPLFDTITDANVRLEQENQERRRVQGQNQKLIESLNAKNHELDQFAYIASHDLREPLRTVSNYIEVLGEDFGTGLDDTGRGHLATIHRATDRMRVLIETLLLYSRLGRSEEITCVPLQRAVSEALENLAYRVEESGAEVTVNELPEVEGYPVALRQLLQNLLANALKFHRDGEAPRVIVSGETVADQAVIRVQDFGIGMNQADQTKIFQLFTRLENSQMREGQGIGLAFCQKIVQLHRGTITATGEPGLGAIFTVTLPSRFTHEEARVHYAD